MFVRKREGEGGREGGRERDVRERRSWKGHVHCITSTEMT